MLRRIGLTQATLLGGAAILSSVVAFAPATPKARDNGGSVLNTPYQSALSDLSGSVAVAKGGRCKNEACFWSCGPNGCVGIPVGCFPNAGTECPHLKKGATSCLPIPC